MKVWLPIILIVGGIAIAALVWWGNKTVSTPSDEEVLIEAMRSLQQEEAERAEAAAALSTKVLPSPASCDGLTTGFIFDLCEQEPYPGEDWPDWTELTDTEQQACINDAFIQTNAHAYAIQGSDEVAQAPEPNQAGEFLSDICSASLFTEGVSYGDADVPASVLIGGYFADRAESRVRPGHAY